MIRETTLEAYYTLVENSLLSPMRLKVWKALCDYHETCGESPTATELARWMNLKKGAQSNQNVVTRLGELREMAMVEELPKRDCRETGFAAFTWKPIPNDQPLKIEKVNHRKCPTCRGTGVVVEKQGVFKL